MTRHSGYVGLVGWTNVGKSTLLNRLVGVKLAAVADQAQTTRTRITGAWTDPERGQILLVDTPGIHRPKYRMNRSMVDIAQETLRTVDLAVVVVDGSTGIGKGDREALDRAKGSGKPCILAINKVDQIKPKTKLLPMIEHAAGTLEMAEVVPVSAKTGEGCDTLVDVLYRMLPEGEPLYPDDFLTDQPERVLAAEYIREKILRATRDELPHATAVTIDTWEEREDGLLSISATILVERESHKGIVIGKGGEMLKRVGQAARLDLEEFFDRKVFLELWVKHRPDWRNREGILRELGIG